MNDESPKPSFAETDSKSQAGKVEDIHEAFGSIGDSLVGTGAVIVAHQEIGALLREQLGKGPLSLEQQRAALEAANRIVDRIEKAARPAQRPAQEPQGVQLRQDRSNLAHARNQLQEEHRRAPERTPKGVSLFGREYRTDTVDSVPLQYDKWHPRGDKEGIYVIGDTSGGEWHLMRTDYILPVAERYVESLARDGAFGRPIAVEPEGGIRDEKFNRNLDECSWIVVNASPTLPADARQRAFFIEDVHDPSHTIDVGKPAGFPDKNVTVKSIHLAHTDKRVK